MYIQARKHAEHVSTQARKHVSTSSTQAGKHVSTPSTRFSRLHRNTNWQRQLNHLFTVTIWYSWPILFTYKVDFYFFFVFCSQVKIPLNFWVMVVVVVVGKRDRGLFYIFDVPPTDGLNDFRWNPTEGRGVLKRTCKMHGPFAYRWNSKRLVVFFRKRLN